MQISFSKYDFRIRADGDKQFIFDIIRKKFVVLTPEEWVRQHIVHYLVHDHRFPKALISVEKQLVLNTLSKRTDIVLYTPSAQPVLIVECKAPDIVLSQKTFDQIARYNLTLQVPWLWVTNGTHNYLAKIDLEKSNWSFCDQLPLSESLLHSAD